MGGNATQIGVPRRGNGRDTGGGKDGEWNGGRRRKSWRRAKPRTDPRDCPPDWKTAIAQYYPELLQLVVEWQRGSGEYYPMEDLGPGYSGTFMFADDADKPSARKKLDDEQTKKLAEEMGDSIWESLCQVTDAEGPIINFALIGVGTNKRGEEIELFRIARCCNLSREHGGPIGGPDGERNSEHDATLRFANSSNRDLMGNFIKLAGALSDPMKEVGGLIRDGAVLHRQGLSGLEDVVHEKAQLELNKLKKQLSLKRLSAAERLARHAMDLLGGDIGSALLHLQYLKYGGEPAPVSIMDAAAELAVSFPVACKLWLDTVDDPKTKAPIEGLGDDLLSALARAANASDEQEAAATFRAIADKVRPFSEGIRDRLKRRTRIVWHVLRGRLLIFSVEL